MDNDELFAEQEKELLDVMGNPDFSRVVFALRKTPPDRDIKGGVSGGMVYEKGRLKIERVLIDFPAEKIVHHRDGDVTFILQTKGCLRFVNTAEARRRLDGLMAIVCEW